MEPGSQLPQFPSHPLPISFTKAQELMEPGKPGFLRVGASWESAGGPLPHRQRLLRSPSDQPQMGFNDRFLRQDCHHFFTEKAHVSDACSGLVACSLPREWGPSNSLKVRKVQHGQVEENWPWDWLADVSSQALRSQCFSAICPLC